MISHNNLKAPKPHVLVWKWPTKGRRPPVSSTPSQPLSPRLSLLTDTSACTSVKQQAVASIGTSPAFSTSTTVLFRFGGNKDHHECQTADTGSRAQGGWYLKYGRLIVWQEPRGRKMECPGGKESASRGSGSAILRKPSEWSVLSVSWRLTPVLPTPGLLTPHTA